MRPQDESGAPPPQPCGAPSLLLLPVEAHGAGFYSDFLSLQTNASALSPDPRVVQTLTVDLTRGANPS